IRFKSGPHAGQYAIVLEREPVIGIFTLEGEHIYNWVAWDVLFAEEFPEHPDGDHAACSWLEGNTWELAVPSPDQLAKMEALAEWCRKTFPDHWVVVGREDNPMSAEELAEIMPDEEFYPEFQRPASVDEILAAEFQVKKPE